MLIETIRRKIPIQEKIIQTVYINNNQETHFRPIADSFAIYRLIFSSFIKYILASLSSFLIDYSVFCLLIYILRNFDLSLKIGISTVTARIVSSLYNYHVNKAIVFQNREKGSKTFTKYYILCTIQMSCSALGVWSICNSTGISETLIKPVIDILLFMISFQIQKNWVFEEVNV